MEKVKRIELKNKEDKETYFENYGFAEKQFDIALTEKSAKEIINNDKYWLDVMIEDDKYITTEIIHKNVSTDGFADYRTENENFVKYLLQNFADKIAG